MWGTTGGYIYIFSVMCCATYKEEPGVAGSTFDGQWGARWCQDVDGGAENDEWAVSCGCRRGWKSKKYMEMLQYIEVEVEC